MNTDPPRTAYRHPARRPAAIKHPHLTIYRCPCSRITICPVTRTITCDDCRRQVDPIDYLLHHFAEHDPTTCP